MILNGKITNIEKMYPANISLTSSIQFVQMVEQGRDKSDNRQTNKYEGVLTTSTKLLEIVSRWVKKHNGLLDLRST